MTREAATALANQVLAAVQGLNPQPAVTLLVLHRGVQAVGVVVPRTGRAALVAALMAGWRPAGAVGLVGRPGRCVTVLCWSAGRGRERAANEGALRVVVRQIEQRARAAGIPVTPRQRAEWN